MNTTEEFENAPVGATATNGLGHRALKTEDQTLPWTSSKDSYFKNEHMVGEGYTLDPLEPRPTSAREALDLAWDLAHEVKEGQVVPGGSRCLESSDSGVGVYALLGNFTIYPGLAPYIRTLEPIPEPEPDWLDAPAILAACGCRGVELWHPHESKDGLWVSSVRGEHALWSTLRDVTPLYPKEGQDQ